MTMMTMMMMIVGGIFIEYCNETHYPHKNKQPIMEKKYICISLSIVL